MPIMACFNDSTLASKTKNAGPQIKNKVCALAHRTLASPNMLTCVQVGRTTGLKQTPTCVCVSLVCNRAAANSTTLCF